MPSVKIHVVEGRYDEAQIAKPSGAVQAADNGSGPYPKEWERRLLLPDGTLIFVRPVRPDDDELFRNFAKGLTEQDARLRFFVPKKELSDADLDRLVHIDYERAMAFIAIEESSGIMIGVVRLHAEPNRNSREFAIKVRSDFQGHGLGRRLMQLIIDYARSLGLRVIEGRTLHENKTMFENVPGVWVRIL